MQQERKLRIFSWQSFLAGAVLTFLIMIALGTGVGAAGDNGVIYEEADPAGDDHGPGDYIYPRHEVFAPGSGLFDIREFVIEKHEEKYLFTFQFEVLTDPWEGLKGFSHPLIHLYFDTSEGGQQELFRPGAGVKLCPDHPWNYHLRLSGWWLRKMVPEDDPHDLIRDLDIDAETSPWDVEEAEVIRDDNVIEIQMDRRVIEDPLRGADFHLFVGSFDPFGDDYFRPVEPEASNWSFAAPDRENLDNAPRVIDWFYPGEEKQEERLADFDEDRKATLTPLSIPAAEEPGLSQEMRLIYTVINLFLGGIILLMMLLMIRGVFVI